MLEENHKVDVVKLVKNVNIRAQLHCMNPMEVYKNQHFLVNLDLRPLVYQVRRKEIED